MDIVSATFRPCTQRLRDPSWKFARATVPQLEGHVVELTDDAGHRGCGYVHAIPAITTHGAGAAASLAMLVPRVPGVPVHVLLGGRRHARIAMSRILAIKAPAEMAAKAAELAAHGYRTLKLKLSGDTPRDLARIAEVRSAAGPDVQLTLDPNQSYDAKQMIRAFARFERHDIALIEQPVPAADRAGLALLTRTLPVAVEADESAQTVHDVFRLVSERACDVINLKITKLGGLRRFMQAVRLCEAGGVTCRVGAAFGPALLQAMSLQAASVVNALPFACELAEHLHLHDDPFTALPVEQGAIDVPAVPGCGVEFAADAQCSS